MYIVIEGYVNFTAEPGKDNLERRSWGFSGSNIRRSSNESNVDYSTEPNGRRTSMSIRNDGTNDEHKMEKPWEKLSSIKSTLRPRYRRIDVEVYTRMMYADLNGGEYKVL